MIFGRWQKQLLKNMNLQKFWQITPKTQPVNAVILTEIVVPDAPFHSLPANSMQLPKPPKSPRLAEFPLNARCETRAN